VDQRRRALSVAAVLVLAGLAACGGTAEQPAHLAATPDPATTRTSAVSAGSSPSAGPAQPTPAATQAPPAADAAIAPVSAAEWSRMVAVGAWHPGCPVGRAQLRVVSVNFVGFDGAVHRGALVVNADVAGKVVAIFTQLYESRFPIRRMEPIENYGGDDAASMAADNTSAYNCRRASQANAPAADSPHANGRAIDLNPYENPWLDPRCHCFQPDAGYGSRRAGPGVIGAHGVAWQIFVSEGWIWQDNATPDYQHFDTGYPSRPL